MPWTTWRTYHTDFPELEVEEYALIREFDGVQVLLAVMGSYHEGPVSFLNNVPRWKTDKNFPDIIALQTVHDNPRKVAYHGQFGSVGTFSIHRASRGV
jgi:hypothetical protein